MFVAVQTPKKHRHFTTKVRRGSTIVFVGTFDTLSQAIKMHREAFKYLRDTNNSNV